MIENGVVACVFCGHDRNVLVQVHEEDEPLPPSVVVRIECLDCNHQFALDVAQTTEQVHVGLYKMACPQDCPEQATHQQN
jgi:hypothetical protein